MDPDLVARKVARAAAWLDDIQRRIASRDAMTDDDVDLVAFHLQLALQECVDLAAHWVAAEGWPPPDSSARAFDTLAGRAAVTTDLATFMRGAVGLRNRIAHGYADLDRNRLVVEARDGLPQVRLFIDACARAAGL